MEKILFIILGVLSLISGIFVITKKNPVTSAIFLIICFFSLSGIYALLDAHFIAIIQILIYAGAIMVLFLFVIMLLNLREEELGKGSKYLMKTFGVIISVLLLTIMIKNFKDIPLLITKKGPENFGTVESIGKLLFKNYLLPFELASILLLVAIIGAVVLAKRRL
jgi:NADH-quinone oxidoreductase subunit J